jgi:CubicO group peptidase (beta-lactamase class C family)
VNKTLWGAFAGAVLAAAAFGLYRTDQAARIASAYKAKTLCSEVFVAGRKALDVLASDFDGMPDAVDKVNAVIDADTDGVKASLFGFGRTRVVFRPGYGCTIQKGEVTDLPPLGAVDPSPWPESLASSPLLLRRIDYAEMDAALDKAFADEKAGHRAILVAVDGRLVAERYGAGFEAATPMLSWSMAKSVTATLVGAAVLKGYLNIEDPIPVPEWKGDAKKSAITWNDMLRMQSGLEFSEVYDDAFSDSSRMLFSSRDAGLVAAKKKPARLPGEAWSYSSGTTNLIARTLRQVLAEHSVDLQQFAREAVFAPIGASTFTLETDSAGNPVSSSYAYATARDWGKLGQLYLQDGVWDGARLLPEGWTHYVSTPTKASNGEYGAQFWLNFDGKDRKRYLPELPENVFYMAGHEGQYVFIVPDKNAVIVRLGMTRGAVPIEVAAPIVADLSKAISDLPLAEPAAIDDE